PEKKAAMEKPSPKEEQEALGLLNKQSRKDLAQTKQKTDLAAIPAPLEPIHSSSITVKFATFARAVKDKQAIETFSVTVPKYIRQLYFFTQISGAQNQTIYHRWLYKGRVMAIIPLKIKGNLYRTWSSKRLSSAWPGQWTVEVLNDRKQVIYRKHFNYIRP
ncbi:MAG: DUF2914 domain-containing protein, partial [Hydrogenovibrio sp.]|nr:DUF2914 domain-containing protein [Hydrogenovibrio sp.]